MIKDEFNEFEKRFENFTTDFHRKCKSLNVSRTDNLYNIYVNEMVSMIANFCNKQNKATIYNYLEKIAPDKHEEISCYYETILWLFINHYDSKYDSIYFNMIHNYLPNLRHMVNIKNYDAVVNVLQKQQKIAYVIPDDNIFSVFSCFIWAKFDAKYFHISKCDEIPSDAGILEIYINYKNTTPLSNFSYSFVHKPKEDEITILNVEKIKEYSEIYKPINFNTSTQKYKWIKQDTTKTHVIKIVYNDVEFSLCINNITSSQLFDSILFSTEEIDDIISKNFAVNNTLALDIYIDLNKKLRSYLFKKDEKEVEHVNIKYLLNLYDKENKSESLTKIYNELHKKSKTTAFCFYLLIQSFDPEVLNYNIVKKILYKLVKNKESDVIQLL